ncbi:DNA polymerase III beta subunit [Arthrobacter phage Seahorse]|uniref:DNA polymerase III beta subunit n=1 Tax=Arthrobacter phage Seahorse TaxID=2419611 RepID=A0A3G3M570_9CAUD|nr:DNA polymerase III beta subunit [Arthrobacter phage Seahorse]AYR01585.1 DNA polymerase III beta subunit [Arthrobacter phage Seahorse]
MKFTITADALADAAGFAAKAISARPAVPVLAGLLIEAVPTGLRISGFDYEKSARTQVAAEVAEPGTVLLQGKMFTEIIRKFGKKAVTITVDDKKATLAAGAAVFTMHAMPVSEFPPMPGLPAVAGTVDGDVFAAAVNQVIGAASTDGTLPILTAVQMVTEGDTLTLRATDRYRLAEVEIPWKSDGEDVELLLPSKWLGDIVKVLAGEATILADGSVVGIRTGNRATTSNVVDGDFPKIKTLFPSTLHTEITLDRASLADVVGRVALVAERNTPVRITSEGGELTVEAGTGEDATGREVIQCNVSGPDVTAAFNPGYLGWSLAATPSDEVILGFQENTAKPALIAGHEGLKHLLMPVRL